MQNPLADQYRRLWVAAALALLLAIFLLSWVNARLPGVVAVPNTQTSADSSASALHLSPTDAARRAAIAKLGFIEPQSSSVRSDAAIKFYRDAEALYDHLTDDEKKILGDWKGERDFAAKNPEAAAELSAKLRPILARLGAARGAQKAQSEVTAGPVAPLGLEAAQNLTQAAQWDANYRFPSAPAGALDDLAEAETLGRISSGELGGFTTYSNLHADTLQIIAQNASPGTPGFDNDDVAYIDNPAAYQLTAQQILQSQAAELQADLGDPANSVTPAENAQNQWVAQTVKQLAQTISEPDAQFQQWYDQLKANAPSTAQQSLSIIQDERAIYQQTEILDAMLSAGIAMQQGNQTLSQSILDPVSGQQFNVRTVNFGSPAQQASFALGSGFNYDGKAVSLEFGDYPSWAHF